MWPRPASWEFNGAWNHLMPNRRKRFHDFKIARNVLHDSSGSMAKDRKRWQDETHNAWKKKKKTQTCDVHADCLYVYLSFSKNRNVISLFTLHGMLTTASRWRDFFFFFSFENESNREQGIWFFLKYEDNRDQRRFFLKVRTGIKETKSSIWSNNNGGSYKPTRQLNEKTSGSLTKSTRPSPLRKKIKIKKMRATFLQWFFFSSRIAV